MKAGNIFPLGLSFIYLIGLLGCIPLRVQTPYLTLAPNINHIPKEIDNVELVWTIHDAYVLWNRHGNTLDAASGRVCYLGDLGEKKRYDRLVCIESNNGRVLWEIESGVHTNLAVRAEGVLVTYASPAEIRKYNLSKGDLVWEKTLGGSGTLYLYNQRDQLQILTSPEVFWIMDLDGQVVRKVVGKRIFFTTSTETFINLNGLKVFKASTDNLLWEYTVLNLVQAPLFTEDIIFLRSGDIRGTLYALNRETGELLWSTANIISNIVYSPDKQLVYALRQDGDLLAIESNSGAESTIVKFSNPPFKLDGENIEAYELAFDQQERILVISLGDNKQLYAFMEK